jgi:hypothetical protein
MTLLIEKVRLAQDRRAIMHVALPNVALMFVALVLLMSGHACMHACHCMTTCQAAEAEE